MESNVKSYTDNQLIARAKAIRGFKEIPKNYWLVFIRSQEDEFDKFDDKVYLFQGEKFIMVTSCTTNKGAKGTAVIQSDQWLYDGFINGFHKSKMECLRQNKPFYFYRDLNKDKKTDETGILYYENIQTQFHGSTYNKGTKKIVLNVGAWSEGCIVCDINSDYEEIIDITRKQKVVSSCLIKEF